MFRTIVAVAAIAFATSAQASKDVQIVGKIESKCSIFTERAGVYSSPLPNVLTTAPSDGGVEPRVRFDIAKAGYYTAKIAYPDSFSSSPALSDGVTWAGDVSVVEQTDPAMSVFETSKISYGNVFEFDLSVAGTVWFKAESIASYGFDKSFPAGNYTAVVTAECIAK